MEDIYVLISEVGFPITAAIALGGGFWFTLKWLMNNVLGEISEVQDGLSQAQTELMNKLNLNKLFLISSLIFKSIRDSYP